MTGELPKKDFRALRHKLAGGKLLAEAAAEAGMTTQEAQAYLTAREDGQDQALMAFSDEALRISLNALKKCIAQGNRAVMFQNEEGRSKESVIDLPAAEALLKAAMDAKKMLRAKGLAQVAGEAIKDLFDSPWSFKKSD